MPVTVNTTRPGSPQTRTTAMNRKHHHALPARSLAAPALALLALALVAPGCSDTEPSVPADAGTDAVDATPCDGGFVCDGRCVDTGADPEHCGGCDLACGADETCEAGRCVCPEDTERCGTACVDTDSDTAHCGACGARCGATETCELGECTFACDEGLSACDSGCVDTSSDRDHCGACDRPCVGGERQIAECLDSACVVRCAADWYDRDGEAGCEYFCAPDLPGEELCDGQDNDCDGLVDTDDPGFVAPLCPLQLGVCAGATPACNGGTLEPCDELLYAAHAAETEPEATYHPGFEIRCDGRDDDCSGEVDEDCCSPEDFPLAVPEPTLPVGWTSYATIRAIPLHGAPEPVVVEWVLGAIGDTPTIGTNIVRFPPQGGTGRRIVVAEHELTVPGTAPVLLDALWNDAVVIYTADPAGVVHRTEYELDGTEVESRALSGLEARVGPVGELRARAHGMDQELLFLARDGTSSGGVVEMFGGRIDLSTAAVVTGPASFAGVRDGVAIDLVPTRTGYLACYVGPSLASPVECAQLDHDFVALSRVQFDGARPSFGELRFVAHPDGGYVVYMANSAGDELFEVRVTEDGVVTPSATAFRTESAFAMTGTLPTGEVGLMTAAERVDIGPGTILVSTLVPGRGGAVLAQLQGQRILPLGFLAGPDSAFVIVRSFLASGDEGGSGRLYALRLSQEGRALCLEAE